MVPLLRIHRENRKRLLCNLALRPPEVGGSLELLIARGPPLFFTFLFLFLRNRAPFFFFPDSPGEAQCAGYQSFF